MNYEKKITDYRAWLVSERLDAENNAREWHDVPAMLKNFERRAGFLTEAVEKLDEIFGASERSGVGENEVIKKILGSFEVHLHEEYGESLPSGAIKDFLK